MKTVRDICDHVHIVCVYAIFGVFYKLFFGEKLVHVQRTRTRKAHSTHNEQY